MCCMAGPSGHQEREGSPEGTLEPVKPIHDHPPALLSRTVPPRWLDVQEEVLALPGTDYFIEGFKLFQLNCAIGFHEVSTQYVF